MRMCVCVGVCACTVAGRHVSLPLIPPSVEDMEE